MSEEKKQCACLCHASGGIFHCYKCYESSLWSADRWCLSCQNIVQVGNLHSCNPASFSPISAIKQESDIENLNRRISKIESDHLGEKLDPKVWKFVTDRLDVLETQAQERAHLINYKSYLALADQVDELRNDYVQFKLSYPKLTESFMEINIKNLHRRIDPIENALDSYKTSIENLETDVMRLKEHFSGDYQLIATKLSPHKCPVCDGVGLLDICPAFTLPHQCGACEGKGIVWG